LQPLLYAASEGLDVRMVEAFAPGGQAGTSSRIENYLGFPTGISGAALAGRAFSQAQKFGAQLSVAWHAMRLDCERWPYLVDIAGGRSMRGRAILIASGAQYRMPDIANLSRFLAAASTMPPHIWRPSCASTRISWSSVVVIPQARRRYFLASSCRHVHMLVRSDGLAESMSRYLIRRIEETPNISLAYARSLRRSRALIDWSASPGRAAMGNQNRPMSDTFS